MRGRSATAILAVLALWTVTVPVALGGPAGGAPAIQQVSKFRLDVNVGPAPPQAERWWSVSGGEMAIQVVACTEGREAHEQKRPGQAYFADLTFQGPGAPTREAITRWFRQAAHGVEPVDVTMSFVDEQGFDLLVLGAEVDRAAGYLARGAPGVRTGRPLDLSLQEYDAPGLVYLEVRVAGEVVHKTPPRPGAPVFELRSKADLAHGGNCGERGWIDVAVQRAVVGRELGDSSWRTWFESHQASGSDIRAPVLLYATENPSDGVLRRSVFGNAWPIRHDVVNVDARSGSSSIREILELSVVDAP